MDKTPVLGFTGALMDRVARAYPLGNGYRFFMPALMRFNMQDDWSPFGPAGLNPYTYCNGDPINRVDPSGHVNQKIKVLEDVAELILGDERVDMPLSQAESNAAAEASAGTSSAKPKGILRKRRASGVVEEGAKPRKHTRFDDRADHISPANNTPGDGEVYHGPLTLEAHTAERHLNELEERLDMTWKLIRSRDVERGFLGVLNKVDVVGMYETTEVITAEQRAPLEAAATAASQQARELLDGAALKLREAYRLLRASPDTEADSLRKRLDEIKTEWEDTDWRLGVDQ